MQNKCEYMHFVDCAYCLVLEIRPLLLPEIELLYLCFANSSQRGEK